MTKSEQGGEQHAPNDGKPETDRRSQRFRFKRKHRHTGDAEDENRARHHRHHHHGRHRSKRRRTSSHPVDDPSTYDESVSGLPSDTAFRESLFDAMGDDEGAAFWENVYGQPIHEYPNTYKDEETGELEQMNDEEYAQFVRRKMWEKSWEGIEAAKEEKRQEREREKQNIRHGERARTRRETPKQEANYLFDLDIEHSLRRGELRRDRKRWNILWHDYLQSWGNLQALRETRDTVDNGEQMFLRNKIAWPVESGKRKDVNPEQIERFIKHCADAFGDDENKFLSIVKSERVRWHPDKVQQRFGFMEIDKGTMQGVTAVFQILDRIWNDHRQRG